MSQLSSADATPFRRLAGMFWRGNPIRALESLVQYNFSASEDTRIAITERMGDAGNPLSTYELIEVLNDPSFNVRYEAIHSIGRMPPEPELVDALLTALDEGKSELSFVITRSLGRLGDPRAIEPLRKLLFSGYHLLEANAARALGVLGDSESIPHFLDKLNHEPNPVLKIAYISALGHLQANQAIDQIFTVLRQAGNKTHRAEIGLALARIAGDEKYYMQHWHSLRANPATNTAQALLALQKQATSAKQDALAVQLEPCATQFAQEDVEQGAGQLQKIALHLSQILPGTPQGQILAQCAAGLSEFGDSRLEIILLSLHTINTVLNQLQQSEPEPHSSTHT
jgi:hypothetical protein